MIAKTVFELSKTKIIEYQWKSGIPCKYFCPFSTFATKLKIITLIMLFKML